MSILEDLMSLSARVQRARNNALVVTYSDPAGREVAVGRQKGSAAVLLGFKNGGKADYTVEGNATRLEVAVAATTKVSRDGTPLGSIVGQGTYARIESAAATLLAQIHPYEGAKADAAWSHRLTGPDGEQVGTLILMRSASAWSLNDFVYWTATWDMTGVGLKAPSAGAALHLDAPVEDDLADLLIAALLDVSTLPRGYLSQNVP
ncbi:MAG TPA: hypothetical protein VKU39_07260 [Streptosporangiaceae bacterium]|nr:hypothetical protein [Streptosporangiaceae bacterium]